MILHPETQKPFYGGGCVREWVFNCDSATLPDFLEFYSGDGATISHEGFDVGFGAVVLTTPAAELGEVGLRFKHSIDLSHYYYVGLFVDGVVFPGASSSLREQAEFTVSISNGVDNGALRRNGSVEELFLVRPQDAIATRYQMMTYPLKRQGCGVALYPQQNKAVLTSGDPEHGASHIVIGDGLVNGLAEASIGLLSKDMAAHQVALSKITLRLATK